MEITEVKVFPVQEEKLKAFVSVVFDHCFMVNDIKVIQGRDGLFISMPSRRKKNGEFKDVAHPLNNDCRKMIEGRILEQYDRMVDPETRRAAEEAQRAAPAAAKAPRRGPGRSSHRSTAARPQRPAATDSGVMRPAAAASADRRHRSEGRPGSERAVPERAASEPWRSNGHKAPHRNADPTAPGVPDRGKRVAAAAAAGDRPRVPEARSEDVDAGGVEEQRKSLKEVEEMHLRDSFWTVP